ncbi:heme lyase CcmF/NrfE family subunit [Berryella wangjianweii]|nr:cytochrome c biogenesis protein CcsA [Berryella wangjianweii]
MVLFGTASLYTAFGAAVVSIVSFVLAQMRYGALTRAATKERPALQRAVDRFNLIGQAAVTVTMVALLICCGIIVFCLFVGDVSIAYVLAERSRNSTDLAWLYKLSGLWAGREGSLLFWAWLISTYNVAVFLATRRKRAQIDSMALLVAQVVLVAFLAVLVFSDSNMPFKPTPEKFFSASGELSAAASLNGMNALLEHWAMAVHPPTLFVGYAGMTVPFAYAIAALIMGDSSRVWVQRAQRFTMVAWIFLGIGIGLGAVWAYVVLGWGGYWGWDAVENASLLSWLVGVALIHTFTVYRQRGAFKRWAVMCSCLAFSFVIVGTFIARSGLVQSVHAFASDPVSLWLFGGLILLSVAAGLVGLAVRWKKFGPDTEGADDVENMLSREAAYYFNNVIMIMFTLVLTYMTVAQALPSWLPFGGESLGSSAYDALAHPLGIFYLLIMAFGPMMGWGRTDLKSFLREARVPAACALVLFALLMAYYLTNLLPAYNAMIVSGSKAANKMLEQGPSWYYNGLAVLGLLTASLLFFNSLFKLMRTVRAYARAKGLNPVAAIPRAFWNRPATLGGFVAHVSLGIILVGLIGSSMFVTEKTAYLPYDQATDSARESFTIQEYELCFKGSSVTPDAEAHKVVYETRFDVYKNGKLVGEAKPQVELNQITQAQKLNAHVLSFPDEDLFVVYRGVNADGDLSMDVRVNPLVQLVWWGFGLLILGGILAVAGRRGPRGRQGGGALGEGASREGDDATPATPASPAAPAALAAEDAGATADASSARA